jgi:ATP-binding protein involved in chromosome partitioning
LAVLKTVIDPNTGTDLVSSKGIKNLQITGSKVHFEVLLGYPSKSQFEVIRQACVSAVRGIAGVQQVEVQVGMEIIAHTVQRGVKLIPEVKNIIAIASGKGGVGKSTTAVNLALALSAEGARVGILDADIYGPSLPTMLGITGRPESLAENSIEPMHGHGLQASSIGFLIEPDSPMVWRGPMVTSALEQLLRQTHWQDLDYLIVDMPPGTGDIQLTLSQKVPVTGAVIVTTPQDIALLDARKGLKMFEKVGIPILGIVENMSFFVCPGDGTRYDIFGSGGGSREAAKLGVALLGEVPIEPLVREAGDTGKPVVAAHPNSAAAGVFKGVAEKILSVLK